MYVGRIVSIGITKSNKLVAMYRVSARSFPNRQTKSIGQALAIVPKEGYESDIYKNPYIAYNCLQTNERYAVIGNGTHVDPIFEKLSIGMQKRDALISVLFGMDYEHDHLATPRIAAIADRQKHTCALGIIRKDALLVNKISLNKGEARYITTYEHNSIDESFKDSRFDASTVDEACEYILGNGIFASFEKPISAACAIESESGFTIGYKDIH